VYNIQHIYDSGTGIQGDHLNVKGTYFDQTFKKKYVIQNCNQNIVFDEVVKISADTFQSHSQQSTQRDGCNVPGGTGSFQDGEYRNNCCMCEYEFAFFC